jgi:hypothetical protein
MRIIAAFSAMDLNPWLPNVKPAEAGSVGY